MTIRVVAEKNGDKIPSSLFFSEIPFYPAKSEYFIVNFKDDTNIELESFIDFDIDETFRKLKVYLDSNKIILTACIRPHYNKSSFVEEVDEALKKYFYL